MRRSGAPICAASISVQQYVSTISVYHSARVTLSAQHTTP